uniref:Uncharacterized protein n=1 Tax=Fundulus heteroclitus TaxID=8078 RepID=A0A3Q2NTX8_FUNHE
LKNNFLTVCSAAQCELCEGQNHRQTNSVQLSCHSSRSKDPNDRHQAFTRSHNDFPRKYNIFTRVKKIYFNVPKNHVLPLSADESLGAATPVIKTDPVDLGNPNITVTNVISPNTTTPSPTAAGNNLTTAAPSNNATTAAPSNNATTAAPSNNATTAAPSNNATTAAPSNNATTAAPSNNATTAAPSNNATTVQIFQKASHYAPVTEIVDDKEAEIGGNCTFALLFLKMFQPLSSILCQFWWLTLELTEICQSATSNGVWDVKANHNQRHFPQIQKTWHRGELFQEWEFTRIPRMH